MNGQEKLYILAFIISIIVVFGIAIVFGILYFIHAFNKKKIINGGLEDKDIKINLINNLNKRYIKKIKRNKKKTKRSIVLYSFSYLSSLIDIKKINHNNIDIKKYFTDTILVIEYFTLYKKEECKERRNNIFSNIILGLLSLFVLGLFFISLSYKLNNEAFFINDVTYFTIKTSSMESVNKNNKYIEENNLTNQIEQYSLVGITKVNKEDDIKLYDILAYKYDGDVFLHRVIDISYDTNKNITYYSLRGDANSGSFSFEMKLTLNDIIGKYNEFQNYELGVFITYFQSSIGLIAISATFIFLVSMVIAENIIDKKYKNREVYLLNNLKDYEIRNTY